MKFKKYNTFDDLKSDRSKENVSDDIKNKRYKDYIEFIEILQKNIIMKKDYSQTVSKIRQILKDYIIKQNLKSLVLGVSGGIDSCLTAALAKPVCDELGIPLIGVSLPALTNTEEEIKRAKLTGLAFCTEFSEINLSEHYTNLSFDINKYDNSDKMAWKIRNGNIKARVRMIYLYNLASSRGGIVLSTDNYTEYLLGFWTLHGDVGDFGMIQELWKTEVYDMAEWIAENDCDFIDKRTAIEITIEAMATDGLGVTNLGDLGQIMPGWEGNSRDGYKIVDKKLEDYLEGNVMFSADDPVIKRHIGSAFKRVNPLNIKRSEII